MKIIATLKNPAPYLLGKSEYNEIGKRAIGACGDLWHRAFKRRHFQMEAFDLYGYRKRSKRWEAIKARKHPESGGRPLVFSGESERLAMANNKVKTSVTRDTGLYHADVTVSAPNLNFHAAEMTRIAPDEAQAFEAAFAEEWDRGVTDIWRRHGLNSRQIQLGREAFAA